MPTEYFIPSSNKRVASGRAFAKRLPLSKPRNSKPAMMHSPVIRRANRSLLRVHLHILTPADIPIIQGRFERWFKQCYELNVNRTLRNLRCFEQRSVKQPRLQDAKTPQNACANFRRHERLDRPLPFRKQEELKEPMNINRKAAAAFWLSTIALSIDGTKSDGSRARRRSAGHLVHRRQRRAKSASPIAATRCAALWCGSRSRTTRRPANRKPTRTMPMRASANRPLLGVQIVLGLKPSGTPDQWKGQVYNAKDGNTYTGSFTMTGPDTAELKGCALGGLSASRKPGRGRSKPSWPKAQERSPRALTEQDCAHLRIARIDRGGRLDCGWRTRA